MTPAVPEHPIRVLVVDDEQPLADLVRGYLERAGHEVTVASTGPQALELARSHDPAVIVLDLGLPGLDGIEVCRVVRTFSDCYVVMLTARDDELDKLVGLSVGADDYLTKPFSPRELVARIQAMLRRPRTATSQLGAPAAHGPHRGPAGPALGTIRVGELLVDLDARQVSVADRAVELTRTEFDLLAALASRPGMVWSRRRLIDTVWGPDWVGDEHLVDVHVAHVRRKLGDDPAHPRHVATVRGIGYRMLAARG